MIYILIYSRTTALLIIIIITIIIVIIIIIFFIITIIIIIILVSLFVYLFHIHFDLAIVRLWSKIISAVFEMRLIWVKYK